MTLQSVNPATGKVLGQVSPTSQTNIEQQVVNSKNAATAWQETELPDRLKLFNELSQILEEEKGKITALIKQEVGKPEIEAETEVLDTIGAIDHYSKKIEQIGKEEIEFGQEFFPDTEGEVEFTAYGVIGLITPWNYPLSLPMWTIIPALLTGNCVVFKPSEKSPLVGRKITKLINSVFPDNVFKTIYGGAEVGRALVESDIDKLFFTGSRRTGQDIKQRLGLKPVNLELGGKDPALVCSDANLDLTAKGVVWGAINNSGQVCTSIERVYVVKDVYTDFLDKVKDEVGKLGAGRDYGPLIDEQQLEKVDRHVREAIAEGANLIAGGQKLDRSGFFYAPTLLTEVEEEMAIMSEETFGPVLPIKQVASEQQATKLINRSEYGLGATIWTKDKAKGKRLGQAIETGMVWINDANLPLPGGDYWGGTKLSGLRNAQDNLKDCLKAKTFVTYSGTDQRDWWYLY